MLEIVDNKYIKRKVPLAIDPTVTLEEIKAVMEEEQKKKNGNKPPADQPWMTKGMVSLLQPYTAETKSYPANR